MKHGLSGYRAGHRCAVCRAANTAKAAAQRARRLARLQADPNDSLHGTPTGYNSRCRCEACRMARHVRYEREEGSRPHRWRQTVTETYRLAREHWEQQREAMTNGYLRHRSARSRQRSNYRHSHWTDEHAQFREAHPPPTLRSVLLSLAGGVA